MDSLIDRWVPCLSTQESISRPQVNTGKQSSEQIKVQHISKCTYFPLIRLCDHPCDRMSKHVYWVLDDSHTGRICCVVFIYYQQEI